MPGMGYIHTTHHLADKYKMGTLKYCSYPPTDSCGVQH